MKNDFRNNYEQRDRRYFGQNYHRHRAIFKGLYRQGVANRQLSLLLRLYSSIQRIGSAVSKVSRSRIEVLGFPCNDYGAQEPDSNDKIAQFCETRYGVTFPYLTRFMPKVPSSIRSMPV